MLGKFDFCWLELATAFSGTTDSTFATGLGGDSKKNISRFLKRFPVLEKNVVFSKLSTKVVLYYDKQYH